MTSKLTRERIEQYANDPRMCNINDEIRQMARIALAAMDSEPVAWTWHYREQWHVTNDKCRAEFVATDGDVAVLPLYRHAQPAPVVPESISVRQAISALESADAVTTIGQAYKLGWNACRAAMLQGKADGSLTNEGTIQALNSPVIPDGYVMVPKEPTEEMLQASYREAAVYSPTAYRAMIAAAPQEAINALIPLVSRNEREVK